jgi:aldehyde dehydrogenase (NAD+)
VSEAIERPASGAPPWEYASAPESIEIVRLEDRYGLFIGGEFVEPKSGRWFPTISPSTEETLAEVAEADAADVARAVDAARDAAPAWRDLAPAERAKYVFRIARQLQERAREFAVLESMNGGKPIKESRDVDVPLAAAPGGPTSSSTRSRHVARRGPSAWPARSSRGTSRC